jgi:hypothetical protein
MTDAEDGEIVTPDGFGDDAKGAVPDKAHGRSDTECIMYTLNRGLEPFTGEILHDETLRLPVAGGLPTRGL